MPPLTKFQVQRNGSWIVEYPIRHTSLYAVSSLMIGIIYRLIFHIKIAWHVDCREKNNPHSQMSSVSPPIKLLTKCRKINQLLDMFVDSRYMLCPQPPPRHIRTDGKMASKMISIFLIWKDLTTKTNSLLPAYLWFVHSSGTSQRLPMLKWKTPALHPKSFYI